MIHTCPDGLWQVYCRPLINFGVPLFIFLSGYLTKEESKNNWRVIAKRRTKKILVPYLIWTVAYTLISRNKDQFVINLFFGKAAAPLYYSLVYIQLVLLTPMLFRIMKSKCKWIVFAVAPISTLVLTYYCFFTGNELNLYVSYVYSASCLNWIQYYFLGLLLGNTEKMKEFKRVLLLVAGYIVSLVIQIWEGLIWFNNGSTNPGTQYKVSVLVSCILLCVISAWFIRDGYHSLKNNTVIVKIIVFIGNISYGIYLSHMMVIKVLLHIPIYSYMPFVINTMLVLTIDILLIKLGQKILNHRLCKWIGIV